MKWTIIDFTWFLVLFYCFFYFGHKYLRLQKAKNWQKTTAQILSLELLPHHHLLWPKITYLFDVGESSYQNDVIFLESFSRNVSSKVQRKLAYDLTKAYQDREPIEVYYNPDNPKESAINITAPPKLRVFLLLIMVLLVGHGGMFIYHLSHLQGASTTLA